LLKTLLIGFGCGILAGLAVLLVLDRIDDRMASFSEFQHHFSENVLGQIPKEKTKGRVTLLQPDDARHVFAESYRNVGVAGGKPLAVTDCLNFGSPEDPGVMWQFAEAVRGLADGCQTLGIPVTGGNVSLYNQTGDTPIHPTPVVGVLGVMQDVARRTPSGWRSAGAQLFLLGTTRDEFGGSEWAWSEHAHLGGLPPAVDLEAERSLADLLISAGTDDLLVAAHDLSDGGLATALVESCLRYGVGASVSLDATCARDGVDAFTLLYSESTARVLVAVQPEAQRAFTEACEQRGVPVIALGATGGEALTVTGRFSLPLEELRAVHTATLPAVLNR
jgi:phosphoribosylformylglycinamidine synthase